MGIKLLLTMLLALTAAVIPASSSAADTTRWVTRPRTSNEPSRKRTTSGT